MSLIARSGALMAFQIAFLTASLSSLPASRCLAADPVSEGMCRDELTFRSCYHFTRERCLEAADQAAATCRTRLPAPTGGMPSAMGDWMTALGHCAERAFDDRNRDAFDRSDPNCSRLLEERGERDLWEAVGPRGKGLGQAAPPRNRAPGLGCLVLPLLLGVAGSFALLWFRAGARLSLGLGFLSWIAFNVASFAGELLTHALFPALFANVGDSPVQVLGWTLAFLFSLILNPALWLGFWFLRRRRRPKCSAS